MLLRYTDDVFHDSFISTIGVDFKLKTIPIPTAPSQTAKLQIWDTAGQERFRTITSSIYRGASGVIVVFDVSNRDSFMNVSRWMQDAQRYTMDNTPMVLVGNKIDTDNRVVSQEEAQSMAQNLGMSYIECSCRDSVGVSDAFLALTEGCFRKFND
jgi:Ras-related protein Rab-1A